MKYIKPLLFLTTLFLFICTSTDACSTDFKITSSGIVNGVIQNKYGIKGNFVKNDVPFYSLPIFIESPPKNTKSFAITILDNDAIPVTGFTWIHWCIANITSLRIQENSSVNNPNFIQGVNSWYSPLLKLPLSIDDASYYGGMYPPDGTHTYTITCYALDYFLDIKNGFFLNELYEKMDTHIIEITTLKGKYSN